MATKPRSALYLFSGDEFLAERAAREVLAQAAPSEQDAMNLEVVAGTAENAASAVDAIDRCILALRSLSLFGDRQIVWFRSVNFLDDSTVAKVESVKKRLSDLTDILRKGLSDSTLLIVTAADVDRRFGFYKVCRETGETRDFAIPERGHNVAALRRQRMTDLAAELGIRFARDAGEAFLERVGDDGRRMSAELAKLAAHLGDRQSATADDVRAVVTRSREMPWWDLADAIGNRKLGQALDVLRQLLFQGQSAIGLLAGVETRLRELLVLREAGRRGWTSRDGSGLHWNRVPPDKQALLAEGFERDPRTTHPYRAGLLADQSARFSAADIERGLRLVVRAREQLVTTRLSPAFVVETALIRLLA